MKLTGLETKVMKILWKLGGKGSVNEVLGEWTEEETPKYTTVLKILQILEKKKVVGHRKKGKSYVYSARVSQQESGRTNLKGIISDFFEGNKILLANRLISDSEFTADELGELKALLKKKEKEVRNG